MKKFLTTILITLALVSSVQAEDGGETLSLNFSMPKSLQRLNINTTSPEALKTLNVNYRPVMEMLALLEGKGAKVNAKLTQSKGLVVLNANVDGKAIKPILVECRDCVIVFEY